MMRRHVLRAVLAFMVVAAFAPEARAAGFAVAEQGAASLGVGGAATARTDLPEVGYFNPAGWSLGSGLQAAAGGSLIFPSLTHLDPLSSEATESEPHAATPPYAYGAYSLELAERHVATAGVSFGVPFGASLSWPDDWRGRHEVTSISLQIFELAPTLGYGVIALQGPAMSWRLRTAVSAGPRLMYSTVQLSRKIDAVDTEGSVDLAGDARSVGAQTSAVARLWVPAAGTFTLGVNLRFPTRLDFAGRADFRDVPVELSGPAHDQNVTTFVELPGRYAFGLAWDFGLGAASLDVEYFGWSAFETFAIDFEDPETPDVDEPRDWHDTVAIRAGYEHRLLRGAPLRLRIGGAWDPTPSPTDTLSPTLPDANRVVLTTGAGYRFGFGLQVDVSYAHVFLGQSRATGEDVFPGTYEGSADIVSLGVSYRR